ncbi:sister chromatid cohesion 1 protein 1-like [Zingiber officinale]|uniref:sister chromatid cohesion 1 protein 1-like n=1 Tax=Zingiber officinale TaxID=94328 RepID=UPI001C4DC3D8|nr:sister chromatid cohesion 1 protein 1-like [Zingiber officinale]
MFYSHQLLAKKAPLGQIWMAATLHAKLNRRKLDKLDIIKICEEILNPSVPMALRLSGILMGGVVIVYERKVKLLYDDVTRLLTEINGTWKTKTVADPTILPKAKAQAKFEAVTLPECVDMDVEQSMLLSDASVAASRFQRMRLDEVEEHYINIDIRNGDPPDTYHQVDAENITLFDDFGSGPPEGNHFERFDIGEDETQINYTPQEQPHFHNTHRPSPPVDDGPKSSMPHQLNTSDANHRMNVEEPKEKGEGIQQQQQVKQNARRKRTHLILDEQLMIPGNHYQSWLQDTSDIVSKRGRTVRSHNPIRSTKISKLMNLPPVALITGLEMFPSRVHFPAPLIELWRNSTILGDKSPPEERHEAHESFLEEFQAEIPLNPEFQAEVPPNNEFQAEIQPNPLEFSIEKVRANLENLEFQGIDKSFSSDHFATPGSQGQSSKSIPSSGSGHFMPLEPEIQLHSGRSKRKQNSSSTTNFGNLDPVEEESPLQQDLRSFKLRRISQLSPAPDAELLEETGPTQTPVPPSSTSIDHTTELIRTHLKLHFDTPGAPQSESLNQLALGMNKKTAALLFYQTCVLATFDFIKVEQHVAYGDILISRGPKM